MAQGQEKNVEKPKSDRGLQKSQEGVVASNKMTKTVVVIVQRHKKHSSYGKYVLRTERYAAHDERGECQVGDRVRIVETRPLSKTKRWRVQSILEKAI